MDLAFRRRVDLAPTLYATQCLANPLRAPCTRRSRLGWPSSRSLRRVASPTRPSSPCCVQLYSRWEASCDTGLTHSVRAPSRSERLAAFVWSRLVSSCDALLLNVLWRLSLPLAVPSPPPPHTLLGVACAGFISGDPGRASPPRPPPNRAHRAHLEALPGEQRHGEWSPTGVLLVLHGTAWWKVSRHRSRYVLSP